MSRRPCIWNQVANFTETKTEMSAAVKSGIGLIACVCLPPPTREIRVRYTPSPVLGTTAQLIAINCRHNSDKRLGLCMWNRSVAKCCKIWISFKRIKKTKSQRKEMRKIIKTKTDDVAKRNHYNNKRTNGKKGGGGWKYAEPIAN